MRRTAQRSLEPASSFDLRSSGGGGILGGTPLGYEEDVNDECDSAGRTTAEAPARSGRVEDYHRRLAQEELRWPIRIVRLALVYLALLGLVTLVQHPAEPLGWLAGLGAALAGGVALRMSGFKPWVRILCAAFYFLRALDGIVDFEDLTPPFALERIVFGLAFGLYLIGPEARAAFDRARDASRRGS
jgi:hypothetical protein